MLIKKNKKMFVWLKIKGKPKKTKNRIKKVINYILVLKNYHYFLNLLKCNEKLLKWKFSKWTYNQKLRKSNQKVTKWFKYS